MGSCSICRPIRPERVNLWDRPDCQALRGELLLKFLHAEMGKEPLWMPRVWGA